MKISWDDVCKSKRWKCLAWKGVYEMSVFFTVLFLTFPPRYRSFSGRGLFQGQENHELPQTSLLECVDFKVLFAHSQAKSYLWFHKAPEMSPEDTFWEEQISRGILLTVERDFWMWSGLSKIAWGLRQGERKKNWVQVSVIYSSRMSSVCIFW